MDVDAARIKVDGMVRGLSGTLYLPMPTQMRELLEHLLEELSSIQTDLKEKTDGHQQDQD